MKRFFDIVLVLLVFLVVCIPMVLIAVLVRFSSIGPILHWSNRVGKEGIIFKMPKFRTMHEAAPIVATHLFPDSDRHLTRVGSFMRKLSLDELPQLWSILIGDMSFVGPRPALFNQEDLISLRIQYGVDKLLPGLTGWAQVNGRDELSIQAKVQYDIEYLHKYSFWFDIKILGLSFLTVLRLSDVSH